MMTIYNDDVIQYATENKNFIIESLNECGIDPTESNIINEARSMIDTDADYLKELIINFDKNNNYKIKVVATLDLWNGKRQATAIFNSLYDCLFKCFEDVNAVYFKNNKTTITLDAAHHDGVNMFKFYLLKHGKKYAINFNKLMN